ncbi:MAG TPA: response regulator transcription factor [Gaiellaceae bacterium]|nr:response regulator transcription factor [Gaiellaceae bacterium]
MGATPRRIVVVDDNDGIRLLLRTLIELEPDLVVAGEAADGASAVELVQAESPDLVVLDLAMPGSDGLQVLEELSRDDGGTRVLVYSGFASPDVERAARELGAADFVVKGVNPIVLIERLRAVLR